jgi:hypothetical protein
LILKPVKPPAPVRARWNDWGNGSADNIRASGTDPHLKAGDMTAPTIGNVGKLPLDQRASSRHGSLGADSGPSRGAHGRGVFRPFETIAIPAVTGCRRL